MSNGDVFKQAVDAFNRGDREGFLSLWADDCEWRPFLRVKDEGAPYRRSRGIHDWFDATRGAFSDLHTEVERIHEQGGRLVALGSSRYRGRRSGVEVTSKAAWIVDFEHGAIARVRSFRTHDEAIAEAGLDPRSVTGRG